MDVATFPLMLAATPLETALGTMRRGHFGGVVIRWSQSDLRLTETAQVRTSIDAGRRTLAEVGDAARLFVPTSERLGERRVDLVEPWRTTAELEALLDEASADFGVLAAGPEHAIVFSRRERYMENFRNGPQDCYCLPNKHTNQGPPPPPQCWRCRGPVRCDTP